MAAKKKGDNTVRNVLLGVGITLIVLSVAVLGMSLWEAFSGGKANLKTVNLPGFHQLDLDDTGLYGAIYQHRGQGPMPVQALSRMNVRLMFKETYEEIPILMNTAGQTFDRFGMRGMPVFNFAIQKPGEYTMTATYPEGVEGPTVPIMVISQASQNIKQTLTVGALFFALFLGLGILILLKLNSWAPEEPR